MKKKIISFLMIISAFFFIGTVNALEILNDDIPAGSYVIGTHLFTREVTDTYDGTLTVQRIMFAAQTIGSFDINDMAIYYKNGSGVWKDTLTKQTITMPDKIDIKYKNTQETSKLAAPTVLPALSGYISYLNIYEGGVYGYLENLELITGVEFYERAGEEYNLLADSTKEDDWGVKVEVNAGESRTIVAKVYREDSKGNRAYSDYSEEYIVSAPALEAPTLHGGMGTDYEHYLDISENGAYGFEGSSSLDILSGLEFYEKVGETYNKLDVEIENWAAWIEVNAGESRTIVAKVYREDSKGNRAYSDYSEEFVVSAPALEAPFIATGLGAHWDINIADMGVYGYIENLALITGVEFYEIIDGQYNLIADATEEDSWGIVAEVNAGESKIIVAKVYHTDSKGNKVYSEYSNEFSIYSITYDLDGGEINEENPSSYIFDTVNQLVPHIGPLNNPIKDGYIFLGWTGSNGDIPQLEVTIPDGTTGHLSYTANWAKESFTVKYNKNNDDATGTMEDTACTYGTTCNLRTSEFVLENYEVIGWSTTTDGEVEYELGTDMSHIVLTDKDSITLYAIWGLKKYPITYNLDGGIADNMNYITIEDDATTTVSGQQIYVEYPEKEGYIFKGWTGTGFERTTPNLASTEACWLTITDINNLQINANWKRIQWRIMYSGGNYPIIYSGDMEDTYFDYAETGTLRLNTLEREGYNFIGWSTKENGEVVYTDGQSGITLTYSSKYGYGIELFAVWEPIAYNIEYNLDGGIDLYPSEKNLYTIETATFSIDEPIKYGYEFLGWTGSNGTEPQKEINIPKGTTGDLSYTANWLLKTYSLNFDVKTPDKTENIISNYSQYGYKDNYYTEYINTNGIVPSTYTVESETIQLDQLFTPTDGYTLKFYTREAVTIEGQQAQEIQFVELTEFPKVYENSKSTGNTYIYIEIIEN